MMQFAPLIDSVVAHIYLPVTGQRQTLTIGRSHNFYCNDYFVVGGIRTCFGISSDPMFQWISLNSCPLNLKPASRDNHRKASYPRTQKRDQSAG